MRTGGGGTRPADAGPATCSCSDGQPPAPAVSAVRTPTVQTPALWTPTAVPGAAADSQGVRGVRFHRHPDTGRSVRQRQDGGGPAAAVAAPRRDRASRICSSALLNWPGRRSQGRTAVRMPGHRTRPGEHREPARPGTADTRDRHRAWGHCGSGHAGQPAAGPSTTRQPCPTGPGPNVGYRPARPADRQIRSLVLCVGLVGSRPIWPAHVGGPVGPDGSRRVPSDRLDDQPDDQGARPETSAALIAAHGEPGHLCHLVAARGLTAGLGTHSMASCRCTGDIACPAGLRGQAANSSGAAARE